MIAYVRNDAGRLDVRDAILLEDVDAILELPRVGVSLPLAAVYGGLGMAGTV